MILKITPTKLRGSVVAPPSKSLAHRAVICKFLAVAGTGAGVDGLSMAGKADESSDLSGLSKDIKATIEGVKSLLESDGSLGSGAGARPRPQRPATEPVLIDCNESGSTLRFLIPIAAAIGGRFIFTGRGKLVTRPIQTYLDIFDASGIKYKTNNGGLPLEFEGKLQAGDYAVPGDISSQFVSGMLFALPLLDGDSSLRIIGELQSAPYVDLTSETQKDFGIKIDVVNDDNGLTYFVKGNQKYIDTDFEVEGDYSQAAFFEVANLLGNEIEIRGLNPDSSQGDKAILDVIKAFSENYDCASPDEQFIFFANTGVGGGCTPPTPVVEIDAGQIPDLVPIMAVAGVFFKGTTRIFNAERLRIKESDRLNAITVELGKLGADIRELPDGLIINESGIGTEALKGGTVQAHNDHRIAMALAIAATRCSGDVVLEGAECVEKSYPNFWDVYRELGGKAYEFNVG